MSTWTLEHAKLIVAAWPEVEYHNPFSSQWTRTDTTMESFTIEALGDPTRFRLPPKKLLVEWTASDVKPGMVFRVKQCKAGFIPHGMVDALGVHLNENHYYYKTLMADWQWSTDAVNWHPCAKDVLGMEDEKTMQNCIEMMKGLE